MYDLNERILKLFKLLIFNEKYFVSRSMINGLLFKVGDTEVRIFWREKDSRHPEENLPMKFETLDNVDLIWETTTAVDKPKVFSFYIKLSKTGRDLVVPELDRITYAEVANQIEYLVNNQEYIQLTSLITTINDDNSN